MSFPRRAAVAVAAAAVVGWGAALTAPRDFSVGNYVDDAHYAILAKSMREEHAYRTLNLPGAPAETKYPIGFPLVLAAAWSPDRTDDANLQSMRWVNLALVGSLAAAVTVLGIEMLGIPPALAAVTALLGLLHHRTAALWAIPLSEPLSLLMATAGLALVHGGRRRVGTLALVAAVYTRTVFGAFLIASLGARWAKRDAAVRGDTLLAGLVLLPWLLWQAIHHDAVPTELLGLYGSYGAWYLWSLAADWTTVLARVPLENLWALVREVGARFTGAWLPGWVAAAVGAMAIWRVWVMRRRAPTLVIGLALYGLVVLAWPFPPDRFLSGAWPLALAVVVASVGRAGPLVALAALLVAGPAYARGEAFRFHRSRGEMADRVIAAVRPYVARGAVLASTNPGRHYLSLGVPTVPGQRMRSYRAYRDGYWSRAWGLGDDLWEIVRRYRPAYVAVERRGVEGRFALGSLRRQCPEVVTLVWESADAELLYRILPDAACAPVQTER